MLAEVEKTQETGSRPPENGILKGISDSKTVYISGIRQNSDIER